MSIASITRISNLLQGNLLTQSIGSTQQQMLVVENELSTGKQVNVPSDNPSAAASIQQLQQTLTTSQSWSDNVNSATAQLNQMDSSLGSLGNLLQQAQSTASANVSSTTTAAARQAAATTIDSLSTEALAVANSQYDGSYLFGGDQASTAPYSSVANGIQYTGSGKTLSNFFDGNSVVDFQVSGRSTFGGMSDPIGGTTDLQPALTADTRISDLSGATSTGVTLGSIQIGNGSTTKTVDLSAADTVQDVVDDINNAGLAGVTASVGVNGIDFAAAAGVNVSVSEGGNGSTASQLGILNTAGGGTNTAWAGQSVQAKLTDLTPLSALDGGTGITTGSFTIANGTQTKTLSLTGMNTVGDLLNAINTAGLGASASINKAGTALQVSNTVQGSSLTIGEAGGTTATDLGIRSFSPTTLLSSLNNGDGVNTVTGDDLAITTADGTDVSVDLDGATTVQGVLDKINAAGNGKVVASFSTTGNGIVLTDTTTGTAKLAVSDLNGSTAAEDLGLTGGTLSAGDTILTGKDVNGVETNGIFKDLSDLSAALKSNDTTGITKAAEALQTDYTSVTTVRGDAGAVNKSLQNQSSQITDENTATQTLLSSLQNVDYTSAVTQLDTLQTSYQAALQTAHTVLSMNLSDYLTA